MRIAFLLPLTLGSVAGCQPADTQDSTETQDTQAEGDTDTDADADADTDSDTDADTDADTDQDRWVAVVTTSSSGVPYVVSALEDVGWQVWQHESEELADELDERYRFMVYPGSSDAVTDLLWDPTLDDTVRAFVGAGGGFIGICGGALLGGTTMVYDHGLSVTTAGLLEATSQQRGDWYSHYAGNSERFDWEVAQSHQILPMLAEGETTTITYAGGPYFETQDDSLVLLRFTQDLEEGLTDNQVNGQPALLAGSYLDGRVVLSSPHPEYSSQDLLQTWASWVAR